MDCSTYNDLTLTCSLSRRYPCHVRHRLALGEHGFWLPYLYRYLHDTVVFVSIAVASEILRV